MIILEFRSPEKCAAASRILEEVGITLSTETAPEAWRSSVIYFFEENLHTTPQHEALKRARGLEAEAHMQQDPLSLLNLATPL